MRQMTFVWFLIGVIALIGIGCASADGGTGGDSTRAKSRLVDVDLDGPGLLRIREDHGIGGYDAFLLPPAVLDYRRGSAELSEDVEEAFKAQLEQSLFDTAEAAGIPLVQTPGECVMLIGIGLVGVDVQTRRRGPGEGLAVMTLVMQFRDSLTGETLVHQEIAQRIEDDGSGAEVTDQILRRFDEMTRALDLGGTLHAAGVSDDPARPGCKGLIAERERAIEATMSAR